MAENMRYCRDLGNRSSICRTCIGGGTKMMSLLEGVVGGGQKVLECLVPAIQTQDGGGSPLRPGPES